MKAGVALAGHRGGQRKLTVAWTGGSGRERAAILEMHLISKIYRICWCGACTEEKNHGCFEPDPRKLG